MKDKYSFVYETIDLLQDVPDNLHKEALLLLIQKLDMVESIGSELEFTHDATGYADGWNDCLDEVSSNLPYTK